MVMFFLILPKILMPPLFSTASTCNLSKLMDNNNILVGDKYENFMKKCITVICKNFMLKHCKGNMGPVSARAHLME